MKGILEFIISLIRQPALFIGFIALLGLILQKKKVSDVISGTLKTIIGMLILFKGVDIVTSSINPLASAFSKLFATGGTQSTGDFGKFIVEYGYLIGIVMLAAFITNVLIAKFTRFKSIYLVGNLLFWFPMLFISVGIESGITNQVHLFLFAYILDIILITISPELMRPLVKKLTGSEDFTIGHTTTPYCLLGAGIGKMIGKPENSTEDLKLPSSLDFLRSTTITSGIVMVVIYWAVALIFLLTGKSEVIKGIYGQYWFTFSITEGLTFAAGTVVLLHGTRMMLNEIVPAFKGVSDKFVKGAIPALDIPLLFPYGQNALIIGFIVSVTTSIITIFVLGYLGLLKVAVIPLTIGCFFDVAPASIFANKYGGRVAAILTAAVSGVIMILLVGVTIPMIGHTTGSFLQAYGGNEFSLWVAISHCVMGIFN